MLKASAIKDIWYLLQLIVLGEILEATKQRDILWEPETKTFFYTALFGFQEPSRSNAATLPRSLAVTHFLCVENRRLSPETMADHADIPGLSRSS